LDIIESIRKKGIYIMFSPQAVIKIERKIKIVVLLNTRADINVIIAEVADAINLFILEITSLKVEIFTGHNAQLLKIYREIDV
jgi:hypothetical protein